MVAHSAEVQQAPKSIPTTYGYSLHANQLHRALLSPTPAYDVWGFGRLGGPRGLDPDKLQHPDATETPRERALRYWMQDHGPTAEAALGERWPRENGPLNVALLAAWTEAIAIDEATRAERERKRLEAAKRAAEEAREARRKARRAGLVRHCVDVLGLPARSAHVFHTSNGNPDPTPALAAARECLKQGALDPMERPFPFLVLLAAHGDATGGVGLGKTTGAVLAIMETVLACADAADTVENDKRRKGFVTFPDDGRPRLEVDNRPSYEGAPSVCFLSVGPTARGRLYGPDADALLERAASSDILVLDDMGVEGVSANSPWLPALTALINTRYEDGSITIMTSNASKADFLKVYGGRIADRIVHVGRVVECSGKSLRALQRAKLAAKQ